MLRDYTPVRIGLERREMAVEFVIHGDGPASRWAAQATPAQLIGINGPRGSMLTPDGYSWRSRTAEARDLPTAANATLTWLRRNSLEAGTTGLWRRRCEPQT